MSNTGADNVAGYDEIVELELVAKGRPTERGGLLELETLGQFQTKITTMVDIYGRLHLKARFWSRTVLLITLSVSAISSGMSLVTLWLPAPSGEVVDLLRLSTILSLGLVIVSLAATVWGLDQRASDCNYAFRRLMSIKTKLRVATDDEARRLQLDYADFGDDLPQIRSAAFTKLWDEVQRDREKRHSKRDRTSK